MSIFTFLDQDELDDLPDDPQTAFMAFVRNAQRKLKDETAKLDPENQYEWHQIDELRHSFMNVVLAAAKRLEIAPLMEIELPRLADFRDTDHRQFHADLGHYLTQLMFDNSIRNKGDSVEILPKSKDRIRSYVHSLRNCIEQANMTDAKREALIKKLNSFEDELEKRRLSFLAVTRLSLEILAIPGAVWASTEITTKLLTSVMQVVAEAKVAEDETRQLPPVAPPKALSPPRKEPPSDSPHTARPQPAFDSDLDDDIPF
jgi:hypothetical protein